MFFDKCFYSIFFMQKILLYQKKLKNSLQIISTDTQNYYVVLTQPLKRDFYDLFFCTIQYPLCVFLFNTQDRLYFNNLIQDRQFCRVYSGERFRIKIKNAKKVRKI